MMKPVLAYYYSAFANLQDNLIFGEQSREKKTLQEKDAILWKTEVAGLWGLFGASVPPDEERRGPGIKGTTSR